MCLREQQITLSSLNNESQHYVQFVILIEKAPYVGLAFSIKHLFLWVLLSRLKILFLAGVFYHLTAIM